MRGGGVEGRIVIDVVLFALYGIFYKVEIVRV